VRTKEQSKIRSQSWELGMSKISSWTLLVIVSLLSVVPATAQVVTSNLQGLVTDTSGAIVPGARVTAANVETGESRETTTNEEGLYRFNLLPRGPYEVRASKAGFAAATLKDLNLKVGGTLTANLVLRLAGQVETVSVISEASRVDLASSQIQEPVQQVQIATLPINDRNFQQLANLIPGVAPSPSYDPTKRLYGGVVAGGATARSSAISVDGGNFNDNIVGGPVGLVPEDAIQEFQVISNQYSAEYGHSAGPFINVVTKSGTNTLHGSGFLLYRQKNLQANGFFERKKPDFDRDTSREGLRVDPNLLFGGSPADSAFQVATNENISWQATQTSLISNRTLNQFVVQFNRFINNLKPTSLGINLRFPSVVIGQNSSTPQNVQQDRLQFRDDFSTQANWHGLHNIKIGTDLNPHIKYNALFDLVKNTSFFFFADDPGITCSSPTSCTTMLPRSDFFALRGIGSTKEDGGTAWQMAYYVQDDWQVNCRLTLNLGLRFVFESGFIDAGFKQPLEG